MFQAGTVASHPMQKERQLEEEVNRNPYQHALMRMHQAHYQLEAHKQTALLQVAVQVASVMLGLQQTVCTVSEPCPPLCAV